MGPADFGIDYSAPNELCTMDPLPKAMNVLRQQMIARVVITAFFEAQLSADTAEQASAVRFLSATGAAEIPELSYTRSAANDTPAMPAGS